MTIHLEMSNDSDRNMISSKEILDKTGISRATLNNYIKMELLTIARGIYVSYRSPHLIYVRLWSMKMKYK